MIKIISGYTNQGGSTVALINLTNALNDVGYETIFYGPHNWHLSKCKSDNINKVVFNKDDKLITHFITFNRRLPVSKTVLTCHEKWWFKVGTIYQYWDTAVFLHKEHRNYHSDYKGDYEIIPNLKENLIKKDKSHLDKVAGIIGSIEDRKKTHLSIERAINDGCEKIYLFGKIMDNNYYENIIKPLLNDKVEYKGFSDNKQMIYDMIGRVYHSSIGEVASLVKDECYLTGTKFFGNDETDNEISTLSNQEIIKRWEKVLEL